MPPSACCRHSQKLLALLRLLQVLETNVAEHVVVLLLLVVVERVVAQQQCMSTGTLPNTLPAPRSRHQWLWMVDVSVLTVLVCSALSERIFCKAMIK